MSGLIIGLIGFVISIIIGLLPTIIKVLKVTGLWIPLLYFIIIINLPVEWTMVSKNVEAAWAIKGLYISLGISAVIFFINIVKGVNWIVERIRGY